MLSKILQVASLALLLVAGIASARATIWEDITPESAPAAARTAESASPARYFRADQQALRDLLAAAPPESSGRRDHLLPLPMPDGRLASFSIVESPIMAAGLAAKYPDIRTFRVQGIGVRQATGRVSMTPLGLQGMVFTHDGRIFITPEKLGSLDPVYRSSFTADQASRTYSCGTDGHGRDLGAWVTPPRGSANRVAGKLLQYDIAVATTLEYFNYFGDRSATTAAIVSTLAAVNAIYERDLGITLVLVAGSDQIYEETESGLLVNDDTFQLLGQANSWIDSRLPGGDAAYDIGHMFSAPASGGEGVANLGAVCDSSIKAGGVSGISIPDIGDAFDIDLVAHEIGHQFNAPHSFNGTTGSCLTGRNPSSAFEPGSGSTIMTYAGICAAENLQTNSDATFHAGSIAVIDTFTAGPGSCFTQVDTSPIGNADPVVGALADTDIPVATAFVLDGTASDAQALTYQWDQLDSGCPTDSGSFGTDNGSNALFRSYEPRTESWRNFPALGTQALGRYDKAEVLPCHGRNLDFRLTVRDDASGQGTADIRVAVNASSGPFAVTDPNTAQPVFAGAAFTVTWDVANTDQPPVSCAAVDIDLLTFSTGYGNYSVTSLATTTSNDGSALVTILPATASHPRARLRVKCSDNIFYDLSDADLTVTNTVNPATPMDNSMFVARKYQTLGITSTSAPSCGAVVTCQTSTVDDSNRNVNGDASASDIRWLILLALLAGLVKLRRRYGLQ